jgi:hypothetical protein
MGNQASRIQEGTLLPCLLKHWKDLDPKSLQWKCLKFYCTQVCPRYPLGVEKRWPEGGSINYNAILQLDIFYKKEGKWTNVPYIQLFFFLRDHPERLCKCRIDSEIMGTLCKTPPNSLEEVEPKKPSDAPSAPLFPLTSYLAYLTSSHRTLPPLVNYCTG